MGILALIAEFENNIRRERQMEALSDKSKRTCEGCWSETFRPPVDDTRPGRQCGSVRPKALRKTTWDISSDISQANSGMASGSPNHHLDWLGYCVGDRPGTPPLASNRELIGVNSRWLRGLATGVVCTLTLRSSRPVAGSDHRISTSPKCPHLLG
jgi:hypothetical protein